MNDRVEVATKKEGISNLNLLLWVGGTPTLYANDFEQDKTFLIQLGPTSKKKKKFTTSFASDRTSWSLTGERLCEKILRLKHYKVVMEKKKTKIKN